MGHDRHLFPMLRREFQNSPAAEVYDNRRRDQNRRCDAGENFTQAAAGCFLVGGREFGRRDNCDPDEQFVGGCDSDSIRQPHRSTSIHNAEQPPGTTSTNRQLISL